MGDDISRPTRNWLAMGRIGYSRSTSSAYYLAAGNGGTCSGEKCHRCILISDHVHLPIRYLHFSPVTLALAYYFCARVSQFKWMDQSKTFKLLKQTAQPWVYSYLWWIYLNDVFTHNLCRFTAAKKTINSFGINAIEPVQSLIFHRILVIGRVKHLIIAQ